MRLMAVVAIIASQLVVVSLAFPLMTALQWSKTPTGCRLLRGMPRNDRRITALNDQRAKLSAVDQRKLLQTSRLQQSSA
jgi:hypothetical protein